MLHNIAVFGDEMVKLVFRELTGCLVCVGVYLTIEAQPRECGPFSAC
jgi:hypothetical protein